MQSEPLSESIVAGDIAVSTLAVDANQPPLRLVTLQNSCGTRVTLCDLGASLVSVHTADRYGHSDNVLLTYADPRHWLDNSWYLGVTAGRVANRIGRAHFKLDGCDFSLPANDGANHLHGGPEGLGAKRWQLVQSGSDGGGKSVTFRCESADGEGGYPGNLQLELSYHLSDENELVLEYRAQVDRVSPLNPTNHAYWNLAGRDGILDHELEIHAGKILELDEQLIPTGALVDVAGTPVDFRKRKAIGRDIDDWPGGYDNYWVVDERGEKALKPIATLVHQSSGRRLEVISSEAGVQFYSGNFLDGSRNRDTGAPMQRHAGLCLETHGFPDAPNHGHFPTVILQPGETYQQTTIYKFSAQ